MHLLVLLTMYLLSTRAEEGDIGDPTCLGDGQYCFDDAECCAEFCNHHWPPTTTPVFGECGLPEPCQGNGIWCKNGWADATCCDGMECVYFDAEVDWGTCQVVGMGDERINT